MGSPMTVVGSPTQVTGQPADRDLMRAYDAAGADRVVIRPSAAVGEEEMSRELERIAEAVLA